ncbi:proteasome subunit alpha [Kineosporia rhizophila]|uniref:proteasome subunit alpha n=1 Tax=Kineosporia TaxID=49184 RepID=UPI001E333EB1|nr:MULTISPECIES: proteasome subunit alpha [Kineosporia]MCE0538429.1 proteasome subunit alpha [Kineosporia rhizophila]GLY18281.1 proteasome subunit alpha [Kineosporia sp. NBRC 101677]
MSMPFYVPPEQQMKDRADYARRNIARGRPVIVLQYDNGIAFVAENASRSLHKISEIYDRMAFAAAGRYNEFENLRVAGVRYADLRGYSYDRSDVTARGLANAYAQILGNVFTQDSKPMEVEIAVAEVGRTPDGDQIYRLTYDGSVADEQGFVVMGGQADTISTGMQERWRPGLTLSAALTLAVEMLARDSTNGSDRTLTSDRLEVAVLDRARPRRAFRRLGGPLLEALLAPDDPTTDVPSSDDARPGAHDTLTGDQTPPAAPAPAPEPGDPVSTEPDQQPGHPHESSGGTEA